MSHESQERGPRSVAIFQFPLYYPLWENEQKFLEQKMNQELGIGNEFSCQITELGNVHIVKKFGPDQQDAHGEAKPKPEKLHLAARVIAARLLKKNYTEFPDYEPWQAQEQPQEKVRKALEKFMDALRNAPIVRNILGEKPPPEEEKPASSHVLQKTERMHVIIQMETLAQALHPYKEKFCEALRHAAEGRR